MVVACGLHRLNGKCFHSLSCFPLWFGWVHPIGLVDSSLMVFGCLVSVGQGIGLVWAGLPLLLGIPCPVCCSQEQFVVLLVCLSLRLGFSVKFLVRSCLAWHSNRSLLPGPVSTCSMFSYILDITLFSTIIRSYNSDLTHAQFWLTFSLTLRLFLFQFISLSCCLLVHTGTEDDYSTIVEMHDFFIVSFG